VHRDVKPENVMVRDDGSVKVLDFGIARRQLPDGSVKETDAHGIVAGTPEYMAPEQISERKTTKQSDQFSWGVMAYELLSGHLPFTADTPIEVMARVAYEKHLPLGERMPELDETIATLVDRTLAKEPKARFAGMSELAEALEPFAEAAPPLQLPDAENDPGFAPTVEVSASEEKVESTTFPDEEPEPGHLSTLRGKHLATLRATRDGSSTRLRTWLPSMAALAFVALAAVIVTSRNEESEPQPIASASASSRGGIEDLPPPARCAAAALPDYRAGLSLLRAGNWENAHRRFVAAAAADPACAEVQLRLAMTGRQHDTPTRARESYQRALQLRDDLHERDRRLLDAYEPLLGRDPPDRRELSKRLIALARDYPRDAEILTKVAYHATGAGLEERLRAARRATEVDASFSDAWQAVGLLEAESGRTDKALEALAECVRVAPGSTDCLLTRVWIHADRGACADMENDARQWIARSPSTALGLYARAEALAAMQSPRETVEQLLAQRWSKLSESERRGRQLHEQAAYAILQGELERAVEASEDLLESVANEANLEPHVRATLLRVELLAEIGRRDDAAKLARDFLRRRAAFSSSVGSDRDLSAMFDEPRLIGLLRSWGEADDAWREQLARHAARLEEEAVLNPWARWAFVSAAASNEDEAKQALARAPGELPPRGALQLFGRGGRSGLTLGHAGRVALLGGRVDAAIAYLRAATSSCVVLGGNLFYIQSHALLGDALERAGNEQEACRAYATVLDRWGKTKQKSVTLGHARERSQALGCTQ
jgi:serine/threonine-protein kinase